ncbi:membrane protein DedA with SNARE-associated domain [Kribbella orskensis]|uniref:Membrane protein DedA with SNARE-associated domain n=1 Tax=Kribbella orskensis TaxID=2512216 RepID=A0ABY2BC75_9ACTN|nr:MULTISPECIES: DedA family protein [Kribbella]TCN31700.1 membrane protein DedA with SNARE-associated domain [Kribbella sp. VKM Ac-2500]TCO12294.1 membrane protein DedA with SNARE-associated domain [Kribbella orskensis]
MTEPVENAAEERERRHRLRHPVVVILLVVAVVLIIVVALQILSGGDGFSTIDESSGNWAYLAVFLLVFGDALCAVFPGETTLNAASTLASQGVLNLALIMVAGAAGAVGGDSALYWIARRNRDRFKPRLDAAMRHQKVAAGMNFIGSSAALLLIFGRYLPGLRFVVNATLGLAAYPYRHFLLWSAIGGTIWSVFTCGLAYLVGTALAGFPLASVIISGAITTVAIGVVILVARRRRTAGGDRVRP